jgi:hypothetical protein
MRRLILVAVLTAAVFGIVGFTAAQSEGDEKGAGHGLREAIWLPGSRGSASEKAVSDASPVASVLPEVGKKPPALRGRPQTDPGVATDGDKAPPAGAQGEEVKAQKKDGGRAPQDRKAMVKKSAVKKPAVKTPAANKPAAKKPAAEKPAAKSGGKLPSDDVKPKPYVEPEPQATPTPAASETPKEPKAPKAKDPKEPKEPEEPKGSKEPKGDEG